MSEVVELLPTIRLSSLGWYYQPTCSALDISGGSELSVVVSIPYLKDSFGRVKIDVLLQTAMDRFDQHWSSIYLYSLFGAVPSLPVLKHYYLSGSGKSEMPSQPQWPSLGRYLRAAVSLGMDGTLAIVGIKALLKH